MAAQQERIGNLGYLMFAPETTPGVPVATTDSVPLFDESLKTDPNLQDQTPIYGNKFETFKVLKGQRSHKGDVTILCEPNTSLKMFDSLLTRGSVTGSGPYTWPLTVSTTNPKSYTWEISLGNVVKRFAGVQASKISPAFNKNEMQLKISVSALASFQSAEIASVSTTTVVFKTDYDTNMTGLLLVNDLVRIYKVSDGTTLDTTIASITNGTTIVLAASAAAFAAGDILYLRPQSPTMTLLPTTLWSNTQFCFGATAAAALSATQTRVEQGSAWELMHNFNNDVGEQRSGGNDPASLVRTTAQAMLTIKKFFDTPEDVKAFNNMSKNACVIRHFVYSGSNIYEIRITINNLTTDDPMPKIKPKAVNYSEIKYHPAYDQSDGQGMSVTILNNLSAIT